MTQQQRINDSIADLLDEVDGRELTPEFMRGCQSQITEIAALARETGTFKRASVTAEHARLIEELSSENAPEERAVKSFEEMLFKVCAAPTSFHVHGVAVIYMPIIDDFNQEAARGEQ